ncbi:hypothetical protein Syun_010827 [Stephania yunnanensis]|uniref:Uncharacterized protein n=1 Tax=Stephania yunnanensis TaxID=152371 RepID=A0AAP0KH65_9MAGN
MRGGEIGAEEVEEGVAAAERRLRGPLRFMRKKKLEESTFSNLNPVGITKLVNVTPLDALRYSHSCKEENDTQERKVNASEANCVLGTTSVARLHASASISLQSSTSNDSKKNPSGLSMPCPSPNEKVVPNNNSGIQSLEQTPAPLFNMHLFADPPNGGDASGKTQLSNGRSRGDGRGRNQLLPRYWPKISDQDRMDPEGKLVMGFRKASSITPSNQDTESLKIGNDVSRNTDSTNQVILADSERRCSTANKLDSKQKKFQEIAYPQSLVRGKAASLGQRVSACGWNIRI